MARQPKPLSEARANLEASIPSIPGRYEQGIMRGDWVTGAASESSEANFAQAMQRACLLYTSPSPRDRQKSRMPSSA